MRFSDKEISELVKAWAAISFAFAISMGGLNQNFGFSFLIAALTVGIAFILHELAHKFYAQRYGCWAEFRSFDTGLVLAIFSALLLRIVFAAPGAVMILGLVTREENGKIAAAGPITNMVLASVFFAAGFFLTGLPWWAAGFLAQGYQINAWLALFNLIPVAPLDGSKIMAWSQNVWLLLFAIGLSMTFFVTPY